MNIEPIKTSRMIPPKDNLWELLQIVVPKLKENMIVAVASKIVSIGQGRTVSVDKVADKDRLIIKEADKYLPRELTPGGWVMHTIKNNLLIPTSGIDESNAKDHYILWPKEVDLWAKKICKFLKAKSKVKNLGVVIADSHSIPFRRGIVGISLAHVGFISLIDYKDKKDLFGRKLKFSQSNIPDSLAAAAVLAMGEGNEGTPVALISDLPKGVKFVQRTPQKPKQDYLNFKVPQQYDLYKPFLTSVPWKKGGSLK